MSQPDAVIDLARQGGGLVYFQSPDREEVLAVRKAAEAHAIIFYTLVGQETRTAMTESSQRLLVPTVDVMGPAFSALHDLFHQDPSARPGLLYNSD